MVRILPKRYSDKLGAYPGDRKVRIIPKAIPKDQKTAIAESSRTPSLVDSHSIPNAERTEKAMAERIGFKPK